MGRNGRPNKSEVSCSKSRKYHRITQNLQVSKYRNHTQNHSKIIQDQWLSYSNHPQSLFKSDPSQQLLGLRCSPTLCSPLCSAGRSRRRRGQGCLLRPEVRDSPIFFWPPQNQSNPYSKKPTFLDGLNLGNGLIIFYDPIN